MCVVLECSVYLCAIHHLNYFVVTMSGTGNENFLKMEQKFRLCRTDQSKKTTVGGGPLGPENFHPEEKRSTYLNSQKLVCYGWGYKNAEQITGTDSKLGFIGGKISCSWFVCATSCDCVIKTTGRKV